MKVRNCLKEFRMEQNISQKELASQAGVSIQTIQSIEREKYVPSIALALNIAKLLEKDVSEIFFVV